MIMVRLKGTLVEAKYMIEIQIHKYTNTKKSKTEKKIKEIYRKTLSPNNFFHHHRH